MKMRWLRITGIAIAVLLVILLALPFLINVNSFRPKIESELTNVLERPVTLGEHSLSLLTGKVGVENVIIADDPAFSKSPFVTAKSLEVGVELMPLIFSKTLNVTGIVLDEPKITLLKAANGTWNFSTLGGPGVKKPAEPAKQGTPKNLSIGQHSKEVAGELNSLSILFSRKVGTFVWRYLVLRWCSSVSCGEMCLPENGGHLVAEPGHSGYPD